MQLSSQLPPLALYIHFPWCVKKCPYCDFNSHAVRDPIDYDRYITALLADFAHDQTAIQNRPLISIFMGGGTPSLFPAHTLATLLDRLHAQVDFAPDIEITLEANPGTLEHDQFDAYLAAGINRLSLGVQSFDDTMLRQLGRVHTAHQADTALRGAQTAGFTQINIDLMFGLSGQTRAMAVADCQRAIAHQPQHISAYQLTLEPNTLFHRQPPPLPDEAVQLAMQNALVAQLAAAGYDRYEVSAYARPPHRCRHNQNYWEFGDYLGLGAGAHAKITTSTQVIRYHKPKHPRHYLRAIEGGGDYRAMRALGAADLSFEFMLNALRLKHGVTLAHFTARTGLAAVDATRTLSEAIKNRMVVMTDGRVACTPRGYLLLDEILQQLL